VNNELNFTNFQRSAKQIQLQIKQISGDFKKIRINLCHSWLNLAQQTLGELYNNVVVQICSLKKIQKMNRL